MVNLRKLSIVFLVGVLFVSCQKHTEESIQITKFDSLIFVIEDSTAINPEHSFKTIKIAESYVKDSNQYYQLFDNKIRYYFTVGEFDTIKPMSMILKVYGEKIKDINKSNIYLSSAYNSLGLYYMQNNILDTALINFQKSLSCVKKLREPLKLTDICINIADVYIRQSKYVEGIAFYRQALSISDSLKMKEESKFPIYFGLGQAYFMGLRNFELSDIYYKKAEKLFENRTLSEKFVYCNNRGNYYYYKEEFARALPWFLKAKALVTPTKIDYYINLCNANLGDIYYNLNQLDSARYCLDTSYKFFELSNNTTLLFYIATVKANLAFKEKNLNLAKEMLTKHPIFKGLEPEILGIRYKALQDFYTKANDYKNAFRYQSKYIQLNDSIRSVQVKNAIAEIDARYSQDTLLINKEYAIRSKNNELKELKTTNLFWIFLALSAILLAISVYLIYKRRRDLLQFKHLESISKIRLQNIRNRISPHFVFNVLNRQMSNEADKQKNAELIELVKLLRKSLEMTEHVAVALQDELDFVLSYIEIEKSGLGDLFKLDWQIDENLNVDEWQVPAMIIQIPVENAIKHALRNKEGEKLLQINVCQKEDFLCIEVIDNGKGYYLNSKSNTSGTKTGLNVIYSTIQILNRNNQDKIKLNISNNKSVFNTGTHVEIIIPEKFNFDL